MKQSYYGQVAIGFILTIALILSGALGLSTIMPNEKIENINEFEYVDVVENPIIDETWSA